MPADPDAEFVSILPRRDGIEYSVEHAVVDGQDRFLILHNDGAVNFALTEAPVSDPTDQRTLIPAATTSAWTVWTPLPDIWWSATGPRRCREFSYGPSPPTARTARRRSFEFDSELMSSGLGANPAWTRRGCGSGATSFVIPARVYDLVLATVSASLLKGSRYSATTVPRSMWSTGTGPSRPTVPAFRYRWCTARESEFPAPTVLYGTGPTSRARTRGSRSPGCRCWTAGMVFAVAHVRGGGEMGRLWYEDGKMLKKKNTPSPTSSVLQSISSTRVSPVRAPGSLRRQRERRVADGRRGQSRAAPVRRVLAQVPFVDPLTTILDPSLPLTVTEWTSGVIRWRTKGLRIR